MAEGRYRKILVPLDGSGWSRRAIPHAVDIARANEAEIVLLHVFRPPAADYADTIVLAGQEGQIQQLREALEQHLSSVADGLKKENMLVSTQVIDGLGVAGAICDYVKHEKIDLVVMSTHGRTGLARFLMGSVASRVMEVVEVPVLLIRPDKE
jgi:nucleotide-binding universal stress UspA family protein